MLSQLIRRIHLAQSLGKSQTFYDEISTAIEERLKVKPNKPVRYESRYKGNPKKRAINDSIKDVNQQENNPKLKQCCILLGYSGANCFGMQRQPKSANVKTIEGTLFAAMLKHKWITEEAFKDPYSVQFQRASRTDKGVSAARQCISMKLPNEIDIEALNEDLPPNIRIFGVKRVIPLFNSRRNCDARTYSYTLPTISFADHRQDVSMETYRLPSEKLDKLNGLLKMFEGVKNFWNFTSGKQHFDPSTYRDVISFGCSLPFLDETTNIEFAVIKIKANSFMMHQIRKMLGLTLAVIRGFTEADIITRALTVGSIDVPKAPGLGLVLDQVHYDRYNTKCGRIHGTLDWINEEEKVDKFFKEHIFPTIVKTEMTERSMVDWLATLPGHSFYASEECQLPTNDNELTSSNNLESRKSEDTTIELL